MRLLSVHLNRKKSLVCTTFWHNYTHILTVSQTFPRFFHFNFWAWHPKPHLGPNIWLHLWLHFGLHLWPWATPWALGHILGHTLGCTLDRTLGCTLGHSLGQTLAHTSGHLGIPQPPWHPDILVLGTLGTLTHWHFAKWPGTNAIIISSLNAI